jgi:TetR/AcrR family transcriptional regulator, transcriptional repressor for nem operon
MGRVSDARGRLVEATKDLIWPGSYGSISVDAICERAGVKKGSFYHFFKSKDEAVIAALDHEWGTRKPQLDALFSPSVAPLDRLRSYFANVVERQSTLHERYGCVIGCFYVKLGIEVGADSDIGKKVQAILATYTKYYETALRDAAAAGLRITDIPGKARSLFAFMEGVLSQARIQNDLGAVRSIGQAAFAFLGLGDERAA